MTVCNGLMIFWHLKVSLIFLRLNRTVKTCRLLRVTLSHEGTLKAERPPDLVVSAVTRMELEYGLALNPARAKKIAPVIQSLLGVILVLLYEDKEALAIANICAV